MFCRPVRVRRAGACSRAKRGRRGAPVQVSEEAIFDWASEKEHADAEERRFVDDPKVVQILEWLKEDEDDEDDDSEDDDDE